MKTTFRQIIQYDDVLGHKYVPNQTACLHYGKGTYLIETDQIGFRNSIKKNEKNAIKIVCIGDSYSAVDGVSNSQRFTDLLEANYNCEILNLAVSGYGIDQQLLAYENYAKQYEHTIVLFVPYLDDLHRNTLSAREGIDKSTGQLILIPKPYYVLENEQLVLKNTPVPKERTFMQLETKQVEVKKEVANSILTKKFNALKYKLDIIENRILGKTSYPEFDNINSNVWKISIPIIQKLQKVTEGKQLLIFPIPENKSISRNETASHYLSIFKTLQNDSTKVFDITSPLKKKHNYFNETVFLKICGHFSPSGHRLVADQIGNILHTRYNVTSRASINQNKVSENGDVVVLGISCFYHDSAASLIINGKIIAAAQEERFTRIKHDKSFPINAVNYCLEEARITMSGVTKVVYYDIESWTIERVLWNANLFAEKKEDFWNQAKESLYKKLYLPEIIRDRTGYSKEIFKCQHHISHAAGAYYPSPFEEAAILVIDGVGEWACTTIAKAKGTKINILKQQNYPHSLGLLYSAFTYYTGFKVNSGEYKLMGLAPYGEPKYCEIIKKHLVEICDDGSIKLNLEYFSFQQGKQMTNEKFDILFGGPARKPETDISRKEMDIAASIQKVTEEIVIKLANHAKEITKCDNLVMSGGVALNCVSNGLLFDNTSFKDYYFQPASGDAGGAMGCALAWYYENYPNTNKAVSENESAYLGPEFSSSEIMAFLDSKDFPYHSFEMKNREKEIATFLSENNVIGYFDGRMEFGPRALGARSILGNPMNHEMQSKMNLKIKYRESFRPFASIFMEERTSDYFDFDRPSPYMLVVRPVRKSLLRERIDNSSEENMLKIINQVRSEIPAITHVDNSTRLQSVNVKQNVRMHNILSEFEKLTGKGILINTSFNVRGEPIVCTPEDAYKCFMRTEMDILILGDFYLLKKDQPDFKEKDNWKESFLLD